MMGGNGDCIKNQMHNNRINNNQVTIWPSKRAYAAKSQQAKKNTNTDLHSFVGQFGQLQTDSTSIRSSSAEQRWKFI